MILDDIARATVKRVENAKQIKPLKLLTSEAEALVSGSPPPPDFAAALKYGRGNLPGTPPRSDPRAALTARAAPSALPAFICEVKKASPSKGIIAEDFPYIKIAKEYEAAGASAISVLTEPDFFKGSNTYLKEIAEEAGIPVLRKDFIIDRYQIYEAANLGASAVLLIVSLLDAEKLRDFLKTAKSLKLSALVETHNAEEIRTALEAGAEIIGVNNRDLKTFRVDINNCVRLRPLVPANKIFVAESGIKDAADIKTLAAAGVDAVLIGEALMKAPDKRAFLANLC